MRTLINPLNLPYPYLHRGKSACRSAGDPSLVCYRGIYYLFATSAGGFYYSYDMTDWQYHRNAALDMYSQAPCACVINDRLVFAAPGKKQLSFYRTADPFSDEWEVCTAPLSVKDPALFQDPGGSVCLYWAVGHMILGQELDPETLQPIGEAPVVAASPLPVSRPVRLSSGGKKDSKPLHGVCMNRWNGRYYLQFTYGGVDRVWTADGPFGPFSPQKPEPVTAAQAGFLPGVSGGSTFTDVYGNLWHAGTVEIGPRAQRICLLPAGLDAAGHLYCSETWTDMPLPIPEGAFQPQALHPDWTLLSYRAAAFASSSVKGHEPAMAVDEDIRTCWCAETTEDAWLMLDLFTSKKIYAVQIALADCGIPAKEVPAPIKVDGLYIDLDQRRRTRWILEGSVNKVDWAVLIDRSAADTDLAHAYVELPGPVRVRYLRLKAVELPYQARLAVSGLRVFGTSDLTPPAAVSVVRAAIDPPHTVALQWQQAAGAYGYRVRYGTAPDRLFLTRRILEKTQVTLSDLTSDSPWYAAVDAFGEGGTTPGTVYRIF